MELTDKNKKYIDSLLYVKMLFLWRNAPTGDPLFQGETGEYFSKVMKERKKEDEHIRASKKIGWEK